MLSQIVISVGYISCNVKYLIFILSAIAPRSSFMIAYIFKTYSKKEKLFLERN